MPAPEYGLSRRELIQVMREKSIHSREYEIAKAFLQAKAQEGLKRATWAVGFATIGLIIATAVEIASLLASAP